MGIKNVWPYIISAVIAADQLTKFCAGRFGLALYYNTGVSFGLFKGVNVSLLTLVSLAGLAVFEYLLRKRGGGKVLMCGFSLMAGGMVSNIIDRLSLGHVIDWIYCPFSNIFFKNGLWFNIADVALSFGALLIIAELARAKA